MKHLLFLLLILSSFSGNAQADEFKFNFDVTVGLVDYYYDEIENNGYSFSNVAWFDTVHSQQYEHVSYSYVGLNTLIHVGFHLPIVKGKQFSFGIRPKVGIGRLFQLSPKPGEVLDNYGWEIENDPKRITSISLDATLNGYIRYNLYPKRLTYDHVALLVGYRFVRTKDNYGTPIIGGEYGRKDWSIGMYTHIYKLDYLREFSDGTTEIAKSIYEFGFTVNWFVGRKKTVKGKKPIDGTIIKQN
ncbi:MAG: hypothetical protein COA38_15360 [Fluviicola sp.]|nr:MAG: hypothetical protein COA38_15360 [Fluviicola sp.]